MCDVDVDKTLLYDVFDRRKLNAAQNVISDPRLIQSQLF